MSVEFNNENQEQRIEKSIQTPTMVRWLMNMGVKSENTANAVLIVVVAIIALSFAIYYFFVGFPASPNISTSPGHIPTQLQNRLRPH